jgi:signal recognition particle subunit SRP54
LSVKEVIGKPIAFAATGEKIDAFEQFHPDRMAGRILGMGDVLTLIEQAEQVFEKDEAEKAAAKMFEGEFTLDDFLDQLQQVKKMGSISSIMGMLPGMPKELKNAEIGDDQIKVTEAIIRSMTPEERRQPDIINGSRRTRIAKGSGTSVPDVNRLVKQFSEMQKMMKRMGGMGAAGGKKGKKGKPAKMNPVKMAKAMKQMGAGDLSELAGLAGGGKGPMGLPSADPKNTGAKNGGAFPDFRDFR